MTKLQFRVLYREFLFRIVDVEALSSQADPAKLFGQFASLLVFVSLLLTLTMLGFVSNGLRPLSHLMVCWSAQHIIIATTMLVVGLFAVMSWESMFPDRRDVLILSPLPVRLRTLFFAKVAAVGTALGLTIVVLHAFTGLFLPPAFARLRETATVPALTAHAAMPPLTPLQLQTALDGALPPLPPGTGIAVGVISRGERNVFAYGAATRDSIFDIGSITKTFTGLILADHFVQGKLSSDEPVRKLLKESTIKSSTREITLLDLATHRSGLPPSLPEAQEGEHAVQALTNYLAKRGLGKRVDTGFSYSNAGFVVLGQALSAHVGTTYPNLLKTSITGRLGMKDTAISLSDEQRGRLMQGYDRELRPIAPWETDLLPSSGAIRSTAADMLIYLEAQLHPERAGPLAAAVSESQKLRADLPGGRRIALAWHYDPATGVYLHGGSMRGFGSYVFFHPGRDYAAVVLMNVRPDDIPFPELLAEHIRQRLQGLPAVSLTSIRVLSNAGWKGAMRSFAAYWITMLAAGAFVFCCVLALQGLAAQILPRRWSLRFSSFLQLGVFCLVLCVYFLQPNFASPQTLMAAQGGGALSWSPSYWFLGLFQQLSGSPALHLLAQRAWTGLATAVIATAAAYSLCYVRTLSNILEEPDILPSVRSLASLPRFGGLFETAVVQFSVRSLLRSRQHRLILAFYLGIGFAITVLFLRTPLAQRLAGGSSDPWESGSIPLLASTLVMMGFWTMGTRVAYSMPLDLRANWSFRLVPMSGGRACLNARRYALLVIGVFPLWTGSGVLLFSIWPWQWAAQHLVVLGLVAAIFTELSLTGSQKLPFTCSYLPGKSQFHLTFWLCIKLIIVLVAFGAKLERHALEDPTIYGALTAVLVGVLAALVWRNGALARVSDQASFEEEPPPAIQSLGLYRDGVLTLDSGC